MSFVTSGGGSSGARAADREDGGGVGVCVVRSARTWSPPIRPRAADFFVDPDPEPSRVRGRDARLAFGFVAAFFDASAGFASGAAGGGGGGDEATVPGALDPA